MRMRLVTQKDAEQLQVEARASPRKRSHLLLHASHADVVQRLMVSFTAGTYIQPHCHPEQWELIIPLEGALLLVRFDQDGLVLDRTELVQRRVRSVEISPGEWHTLIATTDTALMFECKLGPFRPAKFAGWAPPEGDARCEAYLRSLKP